MSVRHRNPSLLIFLFLTRIDSKEIRLSIFGPKLQIAIVKPAVRTNDASLALIAFRIIFFAPLRLWHRHDRKKLQKVIPFITQHGSWINGSKHAF